MSRLSSVVADSHADTYGYEDDEAMDTLVEGEDESKEESAVFSPEALFPGPPEDELDDMRRLGRVLTRERGTPALLDWEGDLVDSLLDKLEQQVRAEVCGVGEMVQRRTTATTRCPSIPPAWCVGDEQAKTPRAR